MNVRGMLAIGSSLLLIVAAAACSAASQSAATTATNQVALKTLDTMKFEPGTFAVKAGQPIQVAVTNSGSVLHDVTFEQGVAQKLALPVEAGQQASGSVTFTGPGSYAFYCSQPGHQAAGMQGTITVQ